MRETNQASRMLATTECRELLLSPSAETRSTLVARSNDGETEKHGRCEVREAIGAEGSKRSGMEQTQAAHLLSATVLHALLPLVVPVGTRGEIHAGKRLDARNESSKQAEKVSDDGVPRVASLPQRRDSVHARCQIK